MRKFAIALAATALVAAACGGTSEPQTSGPVDALGEAPVVVGDDEVRDVHVTMTEFSFAFDEGGTSLNVASGETVRFIVANSGALEHEFRLTTAAEAAEHLEAGHSTHDDEGMDMGDDSEEVLRLVGPGYSDVITVTFSAAGEYDIVACLIPGHYEAGMEASVQYS